MRTTRSIIFTFLVIFFKESLSACLDKSALSSVDALVHKQKNFRAQVVRGGNFNTLDSYISIDVIGSNASQLCEGMIKNFPVLETLSFINANLTLIEPGTFQNLPSLKYLSLSVNKLYHIPRGVFNTVPSLKVIYLTRNEIETIEDAAFAQMRNLKAVHLDHNKISQLSGNIFYGSPSVSLVDFSHNKLTSIQKNNFDDLRPGNWVKVLRIMLQMNQIRNIHREALEPLVPIILNLEGNQIISISDIVTPVKGGSQIYLANNKVECISDDVLELIKVRDIKVDVTKNPVHCQCVEKADEVLVGDVQGDLTVTSTLPCQVNSPFFGNQL